MAPDQPLLTVVVVSPDVAIRLSQHARLELDGYRVIEVAEPILGLRAVREAQPDLVIVDCATDRVLGELLISVLIRDPRYQATAVLRLSMEGARDPDFGGPHLAYRVMEPLMAARAPWLRIAEAG